MEKDAAAAGIETARSQSVFNSSLGFLGKNYTPLESSLSARGLSPDPAGDPPPSWMPLASFPFKHQLTGPLRSNHHSAHPGLCAAQMVPRCNPGGQMLQQCCHWTGGRPMQHR